MYYHYMDTEDWIDMLKIIELKDEKKKVSNATQKKPQCHK